MGLTVGSLFSGIGGLELGLEMCGLGPVLWQCDSDPYSRAVLAHHWPDVRRYNDVREIDGEAARVDVLCGGFPCQPHSLAGKRRGTDDARWLWPEFCRIVEELRPPAVFIENVPGLRTSGLSVVLADLARLGFDAEWGCFSAAEVGAPHRRIRLFVLAYSDGDAGNARRIGDTDKGARGRHADRGGFGAHLANPDGARRGRQGDSVKGDGDSADQDAPQPLNGGRDSSFGQPAWWATEPDVGRVADGVPARAHRLRLLGNAVVPQQAAHAFQALAARIAGTPPLLEEETPHG